MSAGRESNLGKITRLKYEFYDEFHRYRNREPGDDGRATMHRMAELCDEMANLHDIESQEQRRLAGIWLDTAMF